MPISRMTADYSVLPPQAREVMEALVGEARERGGDVVPQAWVRNKKGKVVPLKLMNDLARWGYIRTDFTTGPVYEVLKWPLEG